MSIIVAEQLAKSFDPDDIFWDVSCSIARGDRIALVGRNGTGKTTLLRILAGKEDADGGSCRQHSSVRLGYLEQRPQLTPGRTLWQEARGALDEDGVRGFVGEDPQRLHVVVGVAGGVTGHAEGDAVDAKSVVDLPDPAPEVGALVVRAEIDDRPDAPVPGDM